MPEAIDASREDPLTGFHFALEVQDQIAGYFTECSGIGSENEIITHNVVSAKGVEVVLKIPSVEMGRHHPQTRDHLQYGPLGVAQAG